MENTLLTGLNLGAYQLKNRIIMAPLTRMRSKDMIPNSMNAEYYAQRASAGLIITEATQITQQGQGYPMTPGIYSAAQIDGWKKVTDAVHEKGGLIFTQLWHVGRMSHSSHQPDYGLPVAPSAVKPAGKTFTSEWNMVPFETPRALELAEITGIVNDYEKAAINAKAAGFDGIELHAANGYLIQQFLQDKTNLRQDEYGGNIANKSRLLFEVLDKLVAVWGADKVGIRLSPFGTTNDSFDPDSYPAFVYVVKELAKYNLAYLHMIRHRAEELTDELVAEKEQALWNLYPGTMIAADGFTIEQATAYVQTGKASAIAFGRYYISNPDLAERIAANAELNHYDRETFYGGNEKGYTDYTFINS
ncbi:N-ethylmaleimide reductase [Pedobacter cryoconitis]|uniref:N-ethylmaleimide reductase n=1 Tax=Pedobacter cryoconitis TaxID=188932 RepID=A0A7W9E0P7_9SPHI|nr:alkene reductase [Pedobacter cryoconitis]MBB5638286.1 N-ethylmaleimide reductase [Pedobacter cryoconitis]